MWWIKKRQKKQNEFQKLSEQNRERNQRFYNSIKWKRIRTYKLLLNPVCERCEKKGLTEIATEVHHTKNINEFWNDRFQLEYLESLCKPCHSMETQKEQRGTTQEQINKRMDELGKY